MRAHSPCRFRGFPLDKAVTNLFGHGLNIEADTSKKAHAVGCRKVLNPFVAVI